jgi:hypothetical protein
MANISFYSVETLYKALGNTSFASVGQKEVSNKPFYEESTH